MAERQSFVLPQLTMPRTGQVDVDRALENMRQQIEQYLRLLSERVDTLSGIRGTPTLYADVNVQDHRLMNLKASMLPTDAVTRAEVEALITAQLAIFTQQLGGSGATSPPPEVEDASLLGAITTGFAYGNHTHSGVNRSDTQTVGGAKTWTAKATFDAEVELNGAFNHDGTTFGALNTTPTTQQTAQANITGTASGTTNGAMEAIPDPADTPLTADELRDDLVANTLPAIRNNLDEILTAANKALSVVRAFGFMAT